MPADPDLPSATGPLTDLEPGLVWAHFDALRWIPRCSKDMAAVSAHVRGWADARDFELRADEAGNLVVVVPATAGREEAPVVVLQSHLDMVCVKNDGVEHDFARDPIDVEVRDGWVRARGTTLGADNGLGAALGMAVADDPEAVHGPLELLFTVDEEIGLLGAGALDPEIVRGRILLNLDAEEDEALYIGCAGAGGVEMHLPITRAAHGGPSELGLELRVRGLRGGHSGMDIVHNRGNALKILARVLSALRRAGIEIALVDLEGGGPANAIAREASARLRVSAANRPRLNEVVATLRREVEDEVGAVEPELVIEAEDAEVGEPPLLAASRDALVRVLDAVPHGVLAMSRVVPGLVETSNNVASARLDGSEAVVMCAFRSSSSGALDRVRRSLGSLAELAGARVHEHRSYPGWTPEPDSELLAAAREVYECSFGREPALRAVHAGLECGILVEKLSGLQAVSLGPDIRDAHSPDERVSVDSVARVYEFLRALVEYLSDSR